MKKRAVKIILGKKYNYNEALDLIKLPSLAERRNHLLHNFGTKLLKSNRHRHLLPPSKSDTKSRVLRNMSGLNMIKCNTERYRKSTIPQLAKILK